MNLWRVRTTLLAKPGHLHELVTVYKELNELAGERGWKQSTLWTAATNQEQQVEIETDYEDLSRWERETQASLDDKGWQGLANRIESHKQPGSMTTYLLRSTDASADVQHDLAEARTERDELKGQLKAVKEQLEKKEQELVSKQDDLAKSNEKLRSTEADLQACLQKQGKPVS